MSQKSKQILVGIDGSQPAQEAAKLEIQVASHLNLSIRGLYVVDQRLVMNGYSNYQTELDGRRDLLNRTDLIDHFKMKGEASLMWLEEQCRSENVPMTGDLFFGGVTEVLCQEAEDAIMLALGKHGNGHGKNTHSLGKDFRTVINRLCLPVLVGGEDERPIKQLSLIIKSDRDIKDTLALMIRLQSNISTRLLVLDIQKNGTARQAGLSEIMVEFPEKGLHDFHLISHSSWSLTEIIAVLREYSADLIVIRRDRYPALIKWLTGSTLNRVVADMPLQLLLV
jgi:nucleotide-binding universal stress UspA family protein